MKSSERQIILYDDDCIRIRYVVKDGTYWFTLSDIRYAARIRPGANYIQGLISPENIMQMKLSDSVGIPAYLVNLAGLKEYKDSARKASTCDVIEYIENWCEGNHLPTDSDASSNERLKALETRINQLTTTIADLTGLVTEMSERIRVLSDKIDDIYLKG